MSAIEWTDETWNPVIGCTRVSEGCRNCYAERMAARLTANPVASDYQDISHFDDEKGPRWTGKVATLPEKLDQPLRWRKPRRVFVNSMSDLFHPDVPFEFIAAAFGVMASAPKHTFQVLTKRPERARKFFERVEWEGAESGTGELAVVKSHALCDLSKTPMKTREVWKDSGLRLESGDQWPLPNVWLGTSVEHQAAADERIPHLLKCPAAVRFLSCEPLLGPVGLTRWLPANWECSCGYRRQQIGSCKGYCYDDTGESCDATECPECGQHHDWSGSMRPEAIDWVIVGGESGPGARPCNVEWIEALLAQCSSAGIPMFIKQLGAQSFREITKEQWCDRYHGFMSEDREKFITPAEKYDIEFGGNSTSIPIDLLDLSDSKGGNPEEWPEDLRVQQFPEVAP